MTIIVKSDPNEREIAIPVTIVHPRANRFLLSVLIIALALLAALQFGIVAIPH